MEVFFYGLFMDVDILEKNGINPSNLRKGYLENYTLKIGNRASLIPSEGERAYGILMTVDSETIHDLYAEPSVADYVPEEVMVVTDANEPVRGVCYNLPLELLSGTNPEYAESLYKLGNELGLPDEYLEKIRGMKG